MQPVQLSLLPDQVPAPPVMLIAQLPGTHVAAAVTLLARLMGRAAGQDAVTAAAQAAVTGGE